MIAALSVAGLALAAGLVLWPARPVVHRATAHARATTRSARPTAHRRLGYGSLPAPLSRQVHTGETFHLGSGILFDVRSGQVLWQQHPDVQMPVASLTKMMTALVVVARGHLHDTVLITAQAVHFSGSGIGLLPLGKHVELMTLLYGLLLPSGNDAATALAQHVAGSEQRFVELMNEQARVMGLHCSHFESPSGLVDQGNYSCTSDLAVMAHAMLSNPVLGAIVASRSAVLPFPIKGGKLYLYNNNPLLRTGYPGADGVKTGYTTIAGRCLVASARRGRQWLGVVLLHSADPRAQAGKLLNAGFALLGA